MPSNTYIEIPPPGSGGGGGGDVNVHDGTGFPITSTVDGAKRCMDVQVCGGDIIVDNASIDVNLSAAGGDTVAISDGVDTLEITASGAALVDGSGVTQPTSQPDVTYSVASAPNQFIGIAGEDIANALMYPIPLSAAGAEVFVRANTLPLPTGAATEAKQTQPGVDIGDVTVNNAAGANAVNIQDGGNAITVDQATASSLNAQVVGELASDAVDSGNPIKIGGVAHDALITSVANLDRVNATFDRQGRQIVRNSTRALVNRTRTAISGSAETTIIAAVAGEAHDIWLLTISRRAGAGNINIALRDTTGGAIILSQILGTAGNIQIPFPLPLKQSGANQNWTITCEAAVLGDTVDITAVYSIESTST